MHDPFKHGYCDAIMGRASDSPWKNGGYQSLGKNLKYIRGYNAGKDNVKGFKMTTKAMKQQVYGEMILGTGLGEIVDQFLMAANWYPLKENNAECDEVWRMYRGNHTLKQIAAAIIKGRQDGRF